MCVRCRPSGEGALTTGFSGSTTPPRAGVSNSGGAAVRTETELGSTPTPSATPPVSRGVGRLAVVFFGKIEKELIRHCFYGRR